ncbi:MAG: hypothetical protein KGJ59_00565 [Bacteroidota bacterium]|nr:hypothetical protein [Bacteroidota bacterium]
MISRINKKLSSWVLAFYVVGMVILVPIHRDYEAIFVIGTGYETVSTHADAAHCHHIDLSHTETCAVCSGIFGRAFMPTAVFTVQPEEKAFYLPYITFVPAVSFEVLSPYFHRGPPFVTA